MKKLFGLLLCSSLLFACSEVKSPETTDAAATATDKSAAVTPDGYEFADAKFTDLAKKHMGYLETADIEGWMTQFADNAIYRWNNMDSLIGKAAISDYWKKRRTDVIDAMSFASPIFMPIKVTKPQTDGQLTGNFVLSWHITTTKYKNGKGMTQRVHTIFHFDDADKIDRVYQYLDRAPINAALGQ
jgi:hypothetical protein